jgi:hypothetical protein
MNRYIEEIAEKSHIAWAIQTDVNRDSIEQFANLIIKEALELVNDEVSYHLNDVKALMICETVLEYFGVE